MTEQAKTGWDVLYALAWNLPQILAATAAIASLIIGRKNLKQSEENHKAMNSRLDEVIEGKVAIAHAAGVAQEVARSKTPEERLGQIRGTS